MPKIVEQFNKENVGLTVQNQLETVIPEEVKTNIPEQVEEELPFNYEEVVLNAQELSETKLQLGPVQVCFSSIIFIH